MSKRDKHRPTAPRPAGPISARPVTGRISRAFAGFKRRLFCHRNIIIISDHKTDHVPVSSRLQICLLVGVLGFVITASYSTGNYMAAQNALREKERKIASASLENRRIESEFALLKRDMIQMLDEEGGKGNKELGEYAQFVLDQYKNGQIDESAIDLKQLGKASGNNAVFERVAYLEQKVAELKETHEMVLDSIRSAAKGRLQQLETIIQTTGLNLPAMERKAAQRQAEQQGDDAPRGGPYIEAEDELLSAYDESLYQDLKRMTVLSDVTDSLPLARPMGQYKLTSGFGMRVDPFRKRLARHTGLDFSGPIGSRVYATSDGIVKHAGPDGAYGNAIIVQHDFGISTLYGHLSRINVKEGQQISKGQYIGIQGSTGRSTGPHLHYEVMYNGVKLNPAHFLKAGTHVRQTENPSKL